MIYLVVSGKYLSYVTPRMEPYLYFTAIVMLIWTCAGIYRLFYPQYRVRSAHCFVLILPILFLLLPHSSLSTADISNKYISGNAFTDLSGQSSNDITNKQVPSVNNSTNKFTDELTETIDSYTQPDVSDDGYIVDLPGLDEKNKTITVDDDYFYPWMSEIFLNMEKYDGYQISITGFVFKDPELMADNEFVPARLAMACCVADLMPLGMLCQYDKASELKLESWVTVEGIIHIGKYMDYDDPQITVTKVSPAEEVPGYIYPY
jgi:putative membrane protein